VHARAALATLLAREGQLDQAREAAIGVLRVDERNARAMLAMGMIYRRQQKFELAALALSQAFEIEPTLGEAYAELGLVLLAQNDRRRRCRRSRRRPSSSLGLGPS